MNGTLFFSASDGVKGGLWQSDGTTAGTTFVKDSPPRYATNVNGTLFFIANDHTNGFELWQSDGTTTGTTVVKDIRNRTYGSAEFYLTNANGTLFFNDDDGVHGTELWSMPVTGGTTQLIGTTLNVCGTPSADSITVSNGTSLKVVLNRTTFNYPPASVTSVKVFGFAGNDTLNVLNSVTVDTTLLGGSGNDRLIGGRGSDTLKGGTGNDTYVFRPASTSEADIITEVANQGKDTLLFSALKTAVKLNLATAAVQNVHAKRTLKLNSGATFENAVGGSGNDTLTGNGLANQLTGNAGNDVLVGGKGNDTYVFGIASAAEADTVREAANAGIDTLSFSALETAISLRLGTTVAQTVHTKRTLKLNSATNFENAVGGSGNDTLTGNGRANRLTGNDGNDRLTGAAGNDVMIGGSGNDTYMFGTATLKEADTVTESNNAGTDTLNFAALTTAVSLNLGTTVERTVHTKRKLKLSSAANFENAIGGKANDTLVGNSKANTLKGNNGHDILIGNAGNDQLLGGAGRDILIGGLNLDVLNGGSADDILIAGRTTSDASVAKLKNLRDEWIKTTPYATRVANLRKGVGTPFSSLKAKVNVLDDAAKDSLTGGSGRDWWFFAALDDVFGKLTTEFEDLLD